MPNAHLRSWTKPTASLSLDLDNLWSYMKTHGDPGWQARPTYLPQFVPVALELLEDLGLDITFFVVGVDADRDENGAALQSIVAAGHEVGNHSYGHEPWLHRYSRTALEEDIEKAEVAIARRTGQRPRGFAVPDSASYGSTRRVAQRGTALRLRSHVLGHVSTTSPREATPAQRGNVRAFRSWSSGFWPNEPMSGG